MDRVLISACLLGQPVRYHGRGRPLADTHLESWSAEGRLVPVCPELLAGFPTPRPPAEIEPGMDGGGVLDGRARVYEKTGRDVTAPYLTGAGAALEIARQSGCRFALLTDASPSCGSVRIHGGGFDGTKVAGAGVTAALLRRHGITVFAESEIDALALALESVTAG